MNILVTGGAGFIGSNLCERLWRNGNNIICIDNLATGNKENIKHLIEKERFQFLEWDIVNSIHIDIDQIYNLVCLASPKHYQNDPLRTIETNILGIINMLKLAKDKHAKILQASTSEVYGNPSIHPQTEEYWENVNPIGIRSSYDEGKRVAETIMMAYHKQYKTDIKIVRIFNTYGPNMGEKNRRVISQFITQALKNEDITIYGNGNQTRSFCYVDDLIDGLISMMNSNIIGPLNLGNPEEISILEFAKKIKEMTHSNSKIVFMPLPKDNPVGRKPDITLAKKYLRWEPEVNLQEGLSRTILYFKKI
jgi:UDP-glucuronate decarboxylase